MKTCKYIVLTDSFGDLLCDVRCEGDTDYCATHNRVLRKEAEQRQKAEEKRKALLSKPKKVYAKPNKVSDKRKELNKEYTALRLVFLEQHRFCELKLVGCNGVSVDVHHTASGSNKVANLNNVSTWKASCANCHKVLHDKLSAKEARELGLKI